MATITTAQSGNWSSTSTWVGGVLPQDGDSIAAGNANHVLTLDVDLTGWANGLAASTWIGTLKATQTPGTYGIKFSGSLNLAQSPYGKLIISNISEDGPLPSNVEYNFIGNMNSGMLYTTYLAQGLTLWCKNPVKAYTTTKSTYETGETKIYVNDSLCQEWKIGRSIRIEKLNTVTTSQRTISNIGVDEGGQYLVLSSGLGSQHVVGSYVVLISRNINFSTVSGVTGGNLFAFYYKQNRISASFINPTQAVRFGTDVVFDDCVFAGMSNAGTYIAGSIYNNCVFCALSNSLDASTDTTYSIFNNCFISSSTSITQNGRSTLIDNCVVNSIGSITTNCTILKIQNSTIHCTSSLFSNVNSFNSYNSSYSGTLTTSFLNNFGYAEFINHQKTSNLNYYKSCGGESLKELGVIPENHTYSYKHTCTSATRPNFRQIETTIEPNRTIYVKWHLYTENINLNPSIQIIDKFQDPLAFDTVSPLAITYMTNPNTLNTWETGVLTYKNTSSTPISVYIRAQAAANSGVFYETLNFEHEPAIPSRKVLKNTPMFHNFSTPTGTMTAPLSNVAKEYLLYWSEQGVPKTGLNPEITVFKIISSNEQINDDIPEVFELGDGYYKFEYNPLSTMLVVVDSMDDTMGDLSRYKSLRITPVSDVRNVTGIQGKI